MWAAQQSGVRNTRDLHLQQIVVTASSSTEKIVAMKLKLRPRPSRNQTAQFSASMAASAFAQDTALTHSGGSLAQTSYASFLFV